MELRADYVYLLMFVTYGVSYQLPKESLICTHHGDLPCEAYITSLPTCLVCPIKRDGYSGLSWTHSYNTHNDTIFIDTVRIRGSMDTYAINKCGEDEYTLALSPTDLTDGGRYICSLRRTAVASFNVIVKAFPELFLRCKEPRIDCYSRLRSNVTLMFECQVVKTRGQFVISWSIDETIVHSSEYEKGKKSVILSFMHTFTGAEKNLSCQVEGPNIRAVSKVFKFERVKNKVLPVLSISWNGTRNETPIPFKKMETLSLGCKASNVILPITLYLEVDGENISSENFQSTETVSMDGLTFSNRTSTFNKYNSSFTLEKRYIIHANYSPTEWSRILRCVCDGPYIFKNEISVPFVLIRTIKSYIEKHAHQTEIIVAVVLVFVGIIIVAVLVVSKKVPNARIVQTSAILSHDSNSAKRPPNTLEKRDSNTYEGTKAFKNHEAYDIYYDNDVSDGLSSFVRFVEKISDQGRLQRWIGELSGLVYDKGKCVASTYKDDASESEISLFKLLVLHLKDKVNHENVVHVIGIEVKIVPNFYYTEYVGRGNLRDFLTEMQAQNLSPDTYFEDITRFASEVSSALLYLESIELCHPGICCEKVLLTEQKTCKVYDIQIYPVSEDILQYMVEKHEKSLTEWILAPETRLETDHSYQSDSWSLAVCLYGIFSLGVDPVKQGSDPNYEVPSNWRSGDFARPDLCPEFLYSFLKNSLQQQASSRPTIGEMSNILSDCTDNEVHGQYQTHGDECDIYYDNVRVSTDLP